MIYLLVIGACKHKSGHDLEFKARCHTDKLTKKLEKQLTTSFGLSASDINQYDWTFTPITEKEYSTFPK